MSLLQNAKVGSKIVFLVFVLLVCIAVVAGVGINELRQLDKESDIMYDNNILALSSAKEANIQLISLSRALRNMALVDPESRPNYRRAYDGCEAKVRSELQKVGERLMTDKGRDVLRKTLASFEALLPENREIMDNLNNRTQQETLARLVAVRPLANNTDNLMTELCENIDHAAYERNEGMTDIANTGLVVIISVLLLAMTLGTALGILIKRAVANPLVDISRKADMVANGDLTQEFALNRKDELGSLAGSLEKMVVNLRTRIAEAEQKSREAEEQSRKAQDAMAEAKVAQDRAEEGQRSILTAAENVEQVVNRLSAATEELSAQVEQSSRGSDLQRERVTGAATAMEEMNATVLEVARSAGVAAEGSESARKNAEHGRSIVENSISSINVVQQDTQELRANMEELGRQAEAIGAIMTVISDIADQTNLLALNAAIEAARAGEAGRGFAVVADEVRKLAEKTMEATRQVGSAISGIQTGARQSIGAVERTTGNLDSATELVRKSGEALVGIVREVAETSGQVGSIATAAEEQSAASEEITTSLEEINRMASETADAMQQSAQAVGELAVQSQELLRLVNALRNG